MVPFLGCDSGTAPSLYDPDQTSLPDPTIERVIPEGRALAGVDIVTITGTNFSTEPSENLVYFGDARGDVIEASSSQILVTAPNSPQPTLALRLTVLGAERFSNSISYGLDAPFVEFGKVQDFENIYGITTDPSGNLYASLVAFNLPAGIIRLTPEGERSEFITSSFVWSDITFGSDNYLYAVRSVRAVFRFQGAGAPRELFAVIPNSATRLNSLVIDKNDHLWVAGDNQEIYRIQPDKTIKSYAFDVNIRDLALFEEFLYVTGIQENVSKVWRFRIDADNNLGESEDLFDITAFNGSVGYALAFATTGHLYIGTGASDPVIVLDPKGAGSILYPGILKQPVRRFAWGPEGELYAATNSTETTDAGIIRITSRRMGAGKFGF